MSSYCPAIHTPISVTASNKWIVFRCNATTYSTSIPISTYTNAWSLCSAVAASMTSAVSSVTFTVTISTDPYAFADYGWVRIYGSGNPDINMLWSSGGHASSNAHTILGWGAADSGLDSIVYASLQIPGAWFSPRAPASDSYDRRRHVGGQGRPTVSGGYYKRLTIGTTRHREIAFDLLSSEVVLARSATSTDTNRDFETIWEDIIAGQSFQYFSDQTATTADATYYLVKPDSMEDFRRPHPEADLYSFALTLMRKE